MRDPRSFPPLGVCERTCEHLNETAKTDSLSQTLTAEIAIREETIRDCANQAGCVAAPHTESGRLAIRNAVIRKELNDAIRHSLSEGGIL